MIPPGSRYVPPAILVLLALYVIFTAWRRRRADRTRDRDFAAEVVPGLPRDGRRLSRRQRRALRGIESGIGREQVSS